VPLIRTADGREYRRARCSRRACGAGWTMTSPSSRRARAAAGARRGL